MSEMIPIDRIRVDVNRRRAIDDSTVKELTKSIERDGLLHPIVARMDGDKLRLVTGAHRFEAMVRLKFEEVRVDIRDLSDDEAEVIEIEENLVRKDLTKEERDRCIRRLHDLLKLRQHDAVSDKGGRGKIGIALLIAQQLGLQKRTVQRAIRGGRSYHSNKPKPKPVEPQSTEPTASAVLSAAFAMIRQSWPELDDQQRADFKATVALLPVQQHCTGQPYFPSWEIDQITLEIGQASDRAEKASDPKVRRSIRAMVDRQHETLNA